MLLPTDLHYQFENTWDIIITGGRNIFRNIYFENRYLSILKIFFRIRDFFRDKE